MAPLRFLTGSGSGLSPGGQPQGGRPHSLPITQRRLRRRAQLPADGHSASPPYPPTLELGASAPASRPAGRHSDHFPSEKIDHSPEFPQTHWPHPFLSGWPLHFLPGSVFPFPPITSGLPFPPPQPVPLTLLPLLPHTLVHTAQANQATLSQR